MTSLQIGDRLVFPGAFITFVFPICTTKCIDFVRECGFGHKFIHLDEWLSWALVKE